MSQNEKEDEDGKVISLAEKRRAASKTPTLPRRLKGASAKKVPSTPPRSRFGFRLAQVLQLAAVVFGFYIVMRSCSH